MDIARLSVQAKAKPRILPPAQLVSQVSTNLIAFVDKEHGYVRARLGGPVWDNFVQKMKVYRLGRVLFQNSFRIAEVARLRLTTSTTVSNPYTLRLK